MNTWRFIGITFALIALLSVSPTVTASRIDQPLPSAIYAEPTETPPGQDDVTAQKIAQAIADAFKIPVDDVLKLRESNMGYGEIVIALALAQKSGKSASEILALRAEGQGWGAITKTLNPDRTKLIKLGNLMRAKEIDTTGTPGNSGDHRQDTAKGKDKSDNEDKPGDEKNGNPNKDDKGNNKSKGK